MSACAASTEWVWWVGMTAIFVMGISLGMVIGNAIRGVR